MNTDEIIRGFDANTRKWILLQERISLQERLEHLTIRTDMQHFRRSLILWIILTPVLVYGTIVAIMFYLVSALGHWKP